MKKSEIKPTFVIICIAILIAAYGISICIQEIMLYKTQSAEVKILSKQIQENKSSSANNESQENLYAQNRRNRQRNITTNNTGRSNPMGGGFGNNQNGFGNGQRGLGNSGFPGQGGFRNPTTSGGQTPLDATSAAVDPIAFGSFGGDPAAFGGFNAFGGNPAAFSGFGNFGGDPTTAGPFGVDTTALDEIGAVDQQVNQEDIYYQN